MILKSGKKFNFFMSQGPGPAACIITFTFVRLIGPGCPTPHRSS